MLRGTWCVYILCFFMLLDPENLRNYRPISNLSFLSKILEKIVAKRLSDYMTVHHLQEKMQSAYKTGHSTESALLRIQNDILHDLDKKRGVILVLLDLSAAFDTIDHDLLLQRLWCHRYCIAVVFLIPQRPK